MTFHLNHAAVLLSRTPFVLKELLTGLPPEWLYANEGGDTWSPYDVVGHLIHGERTDWIPRAKIILEFGESRPFEPFDRAAHMEESKGKSIVELLDTFERLRAENLRTLHAMNLTEPDLAKTGLHPQFGRVTLRELLATWVAHDLGHIAQVSRVMAKQYRDAVGPWIAYLPVLTDHPTPRS
jgi:hypothetical protein